MTTTYYTIKGKNDGFGAQYQAILSGISYCNYENYIYIHTEFTEIGHNVDVTKANQFIGISNRVVMPSNCKLLEFPYVYKVHFCERPSIYYTDKVIEYVRNCYFSTEKPLIGDIDIAIHIRRGDVKNNTNDGYDRYVDNTFYTEIIKKLKAKYPTYTITVFSEGKYEDFKELGLEENCFKLNTDIFETFHSLVCAKVLIQACSSLSYCAGMINKNTVYHLDTFWHKKLDHWLKLSSLQEEKEKEKEKPDT